MSGSSEKDAICCCFRLHASFMLGDDAALFKDRCDVIVLASVGVYSEAIQRSYCDNRDHGSPTFLFFYRGRLVEIKRQ